jgi:hypothetical protein
MSAAEMKKQGGRGDAPAAGAGAPRAELSPADVAVAAEARALTESLLLNRSVTVLIGGVDKFGNLFGRVDLRGGAGAGVDVAAELLRGGFGRIADFSLGFTSPAGHGGTLRLAERAAKAACTRLWRDHVAAAVVAVGDREGMFVAKLRSSVSLRVNRGRKICTISSDRSVHVAVKLTVIARGTFTVLDENPTEPSVKAHSRHTKQSKTTSRSSAVAITALLSVIKQGSFPFHGK